MTAGRNVITQSQSWGTPEKYVKAVKKFFGGDIDLDPCSNKFSIVGALNEFMLPNQDGLELDWNYKRIFVNPPYGIDKDRKTSIKNWISKCSLANSEFKSEVIALIPVAVNTSHWKKFIFTKATAVCFLYDTRLKFLENGIDTGKGAPMACSLVYWGSEYKLFYKIFIEYGAVVNISNLKNEKIGSDRFFEGNPIFT
jgi:DNA N-6-adenine-methyltransferase (Dam)